MSRAILAFLLVCMPLAIASASGGSALPPAPTVEVTSETLNVRSNPSSTGRVLGTLEQGQRVMAPGPAEDGWLFVRAEDGVSGYVAAKFVRSVPPVNSAPAARR